MQRAASSSPSRDRLIVLLALGWMLFLAGRHLLGNGLWYVPSLVVDEFAHTLPTLHLGPYFGEFWCARLFDSLVVIGLLAAGFAVGVTTFDRWLPRRDLLTGLLCLAGGLWMLAAATLAVGIVSVAHVPWLFLSLGAWALPAPRRFFAKTLCEGLLTPHSPRPKVSESTPNVETLRSTGVARSGDLRQTANLFGGPTAWMVFLMVLIVVAALASLPGALAPPFEYDELEYHLGAITDYQRAGRIVFLPHNFYSNLPQLTEMLYLLVRLDGAAKLLHWAFGLLAAASVFAVGARLWGRPVGLLAAALFYCTSFVQDLSITARIDLATAFFATLAFGAFLVGRETEKPEWLWWSGLMAGAAVATKWPAVSVVFLPLLVGQRSVVCGLLSAVVVLPWLAKNWMLTGNPVYPLLNHWFGNLHWLPEQAALFARKHYPPAWTWVQAGEFFRSMWRYAFDQLQPGPLLLMTAPLVLLVRKADRNARRAGWLLVAGYVGWFCLTFRPWRFLFPVSGLAALVGAYAISTLAREGWSRVAVRGVIGFLLFTNVSVELVRVLADWEDPRRNTPQMSCLHLMTGQVSRDEWIARLGGGIFEPIMWMNHNLPANAKVLYIGEARLHFTRHAALWSTAFDQHPLTALLRDTHSVEQLLATLRRQGVTHVYIMPSELERLRKGYGYLAQIDWGRVDALLRQPRARPVHVVRTGLVYELAQP